MVVVRDPFSPGVPVASKDFVGRVDVIESVARGVFETETSKALISILGQRRIGKSSLLNKLVDLWRGQHSDVLVLRFDCQAYSGGEAEHLVSDVVRSVSTESGPSISDRKRYWHSLAVALECSRRVILLLDEFDALAGQERRGYDGGFFEGLRSILISQAARNRLTLITATRKTLDKIEWLHDVKGSPLFGITGQKVHIGHLLREEAEEILSRGSSFLSPKEQKFLLKLSGPHPHFLHLAGSVSWNVKRVGTPGFEKAVMDQFLDLASGIYKSLLSSLDERVREKVYLQALKGTSVDESDDGDLKGELLVDGEGKLFSDGLRAFCLRDRNEILCVLRRRFLRLPRAQREVLGLHSVSGEPIQESSRWLLREDGWVDREGIVHEALRKWIFPLLEDY